jgi:hypothetical protein
LYEVKGLIELFIKPCDSKVPEGSISSIIDDSCSSSGISSDEILEADTTLEPELSFLTILFYFFPLLP